MAVISEGFSMGTLTSTEGRSRETLIAQDNVPRQWRQYAGLNFLLSVSTISGGSGRRSGKLEAMSNKWPPLHSWSAAFIALIVGFGGTIALVVQALRTLGASVEQTGSAVTALCLGMAIGSAALSLKTRM